MTSFSEPNNVQLSCESLELPTVRFHALTSALHEAERRLIGAIAVERALSLESLIELNRRCAACPALESWLDARVESGLLVQLGRAQAGSVASARDAVYALGPAFEQLTVRALAERDELEAVVAVTRAVLGGRSVADIARALAVGDWADFVRAHAKKRLPHPMGDRSRAEWLRRSLCEPFDAAWLTRTWNEKSFEVSLRA